MSNEPELLTFDRVYHVLDERAGSDLRFRSAVITSTAVHTGVTLAFLLAPLFMPTPVLFNFTPVNLVALAPEPELAPAPVIEEEERQALEPEPPEIDQPEDVPEDLEAQRQKEAEEEARRRAEEEEQRRAEEERRAREEAAQRRRAEEERRRREEEEQRRAPQEATRSSRTQEQPQATQRAERGAVDFLGSEEARLTEEEFGFSYWLNRVLLNISIKWDPPARAMGSREILTVVYFRVDRSGKIIVGPEIRTGSGNRGYDRAAMRAISAGQPFPPLPQAFRGRSLGINLGFRQE